MAHKPRIDDEPAMDTLAPGALDRMHARIAQLTLWLCDRGYLEYPLGLTVASHPSLQFADRVHRLFKLQTLAGELTGVILPRIRRKIAFRPGRLSETHRLHIRGALDVPRTMRTGYAAAAMPALSEYVSARPSKDFRTPENLLAVVSVRQVMDEAKRLLGDASVLLPEERRLLHTMIRRCMRALRPSIFAGLTPETDVQPGRGALERLIHEASQSIRQIKGAHNGYQELLDWRARYDAFTVTGPEGAYRTPVRATSPDRAYELLIVLELLVRLSRHARIRQNDPCWRHGSRADAPAFACRFRDGDRWEVYIQSALPVSHQRYLPHLTGIPDMIIRNPATGRLLITDAKQYTRTSYGAAFYKMMGYLYQFGYPAGFDAVAGGVLCVPERIGEEPGWTVWAGGDGQRQALATLTIPADGIIAEETRRNSDRFLAFAKRVLKQT